jgi:hypothetical protein
MASTAADRPRRGCPDPPIITKVIGIIYLTE